MTLPGSPENSSQGFVLWGSKGHGLVLLDVIRASGNDVVALCDNDAEAVSIAPPLPVHVGFDGLRRWLTGYRGSRPAAAIAIGGGRGQHRERIATELSTLGIDTPPLLHARATVSPSAAISRGVQVLANAVVASGASLAPHVIVNNSANIDHECQLGVGVHVAPGAVLCGCVVVADYAFIGAGAVILPRIRIGVGATVGAGATVTRDVAPHDVVVGCPARSLRSAR